MADSIVLGGVESGFAMAQGETGKLEVCLSRQEKHSKFDKDD